MSADRDPIGPPTPADVEAMARLDGIELRNGEAAELFEIVAALVEAAARAEGREMLRVPVQGGVRDPGRRPTPEEDPYNAFIRRCLVEGEPDGPLAGRTVAVKDNIAVAGVPMTEGSHFPPFTPTVDAVVVERMLGAGATLVGTLNMDDHAGGATGVMSAFGPSRNPVDPSRSAGGSSTGAGAAVRSDAVDFSLGVDQGGSGRIPAAYCGVVGVKATHGLVPTFGVGHIDHTIDHVTPLARSVHGAALLLEVVAGEDWRDPQWVRGPITAGEYTSAAGQGVEGMRIGVVEEGVTSVECDDAVVEGLECAVAALRDAGAVADRFSLPIWADGFATFQPFVAHMIANMIRSEGVGYGHLGYVDVDRLHAFAVARRASSRNLNPYVKCWMLADRYLHERYLNVSFGILQNQRLLIRRRISEALADWDLLLTPTVPTVAPKLLGPDPSIADLLAHSPESVAFNTAPLNLSGHPALSIPTEWGRDGALPTAVQLIAPHFGEQAAFRAAFALEETIGPFQ
ncbi:MAG TPA: amidase family protein [Gaiellaceae bacterium]